MAVMVQHDDKQRVWLAAQATHTEPGYVYVLGLRHDRETLLRQIEASERLHRPALEALPTPPTRSR